MYVVRLTADPVQAWAVYWDHPVRGEQHVVIECVVGVDPMGALRSFVPPGARFRVRQLTV